MEDFPIRLNDHEVNIVFASQQYSSSLTLIARLHEK